MSTSADAAPKRVVLHVGAPKSGTTFLQRALWNLRDELASTGFVCPGGRQQEMFRAAIEVRERADYWGYDPDALTGTWKKLCREAREHDGTTIMSHELLGAATAEQVGRALAELEGLDVHLVFTARDLVRQVTSEWQERVKNGGTMTFRKFQRSIEKRTRDEEFGGSFWRSQDVLDVLDRWGSGIPAANTHVVVAPRSGSGPEVLWHRFGEAVGFAAERFDPSTGDGTTNQTLGAVQVAILRQVNEALDGRIKQPQYARIVKRQFAQKLLAAQTSPKPTCPAGLVEELQKLAETHNDGITARGYVVHGDLAELVPELPAEGRPAPDEVDPEETTAAAVAAIADLLVERAEKPAPRGGRARPAPADDEVDGTTPVRRLGQRVKRRLRG